METEELLPSRKQRRPVVDKYIDVAVYSSYYSTKRALGVCTVGEEQEPATPYVLVAFVAPSC